ncbi:MAG: hypothetical protein GOV02_00420 [Candidatus Aenigmarchaeota archaeon]|nr:hypothetical protein [Candidatus Aenigmarchaeota archaeon]
MKKTQEDNTKPEVTVDENAPSVDVSNDENAETPTDEAAPEVEQPTLFDADAFTKEEVADVADAIEEPVSTEELEQMEETFSWDSIESEPDIQTEEEIEDVMTEEEPTTPQEAYQERAQEKTTDDLSDPSSPDDQKDNAWKSVAKELNIEAEDYNDFISKAKEKTTKEQVVISEDSNLNRINKLLSLDSESRIRAVLGENSEYTEEDIDDFIDNAKDNGNLKFEDKNILGQLKKQKDDYVSFMQKKEQDKIALADENVKNFKKNLDSNLSKTENILGGEISNDDRKAVSSFISTGKFQEELLKDPNTLIEAAFFVLNKPKIQKIWSAKGKSAGKKEFLDKLAPTKQVKKSALVDNENENVGFDASKFVNG